MNTFYTHLLFLFLFLLLANTLLPPSSATNTTAERCHPHDKRVLLRINRETYNNSIASWDPNTDCCNGWSFVTCDASTNRIHSFNDYSSTPFPTSIGDLPYLEFVEVYFKSTGPIPASLAKLHHLVTISLNYDSLTGPIPSFFSTFQNLTYLDLQNNLLSGPLPPSLGLAPSLSTLFLRNNRLTGPIPDSFGSFKQPNFNLFIENNTLSGMLPRSLERVMFEIFAVGENMLEGDPSFIFGEDKTMLSWVDLSSNDFSFDMTNVGISHTLNIFFLYHNKIYGSLPKGLARIPQLHVFDVSSNQLCGRIPTGGNLKNFDKTNYLHNKCLCGTPLPPCK